MTTWMRHPQLPSDQLIEVDDMSVPHHRSAGWTVTTAPPPPRPQSGSSEEAPEGAASVPEPAPRALKARRAPKEADEK